jgi:CheY-like chemotaxis protein
MRSVGVLDSDKPLVLVVDDEAALAAMLRYNLERHGFLVEHATNGRAALVRIAESRPDLVLLDWTLPSISGIEVCRQLRSRPDTRDLRVIMVTGRTGDQDAVRGLDAGADDYVVKPFSVDPPQLLLKRLWRAATLSALWGNAWDRGAVCRSVRSRIQRCPAAQRYHGRSIIWPGPHSLLGILSIAPGASQSFVIALTPNAPVAPTIVALGFDCAGIDAARSNAGLNTLLYSASTTTVPDIVALAATA